MVAIIITGLVLMFIAGTIYSVARRAAEAGNRRRERHLGDRPVE